MKPKEEISALRFPEFHGKWDVKRLDQLTTKIGDGLHSTPVYDELGEYFFINGNNLVDGRIVITDSTKKVSQAESDKYKIDLDDKSILLSINGTIGSLALYNKERVVLGKSACYLNVSTAADRIFVFNLLQTAGVKNHFFSELTGSTIKNLSLSTIRNCPVHIPILPEQQKIAAFLSAVDEKIGHLVTKRELLLKYKKGVMQQIFDQKIRFKDDNGNDFPEWGEKSFGEVYSFLPTNSFSREDLNYQDGEVRNIHYGDIHTKFRSLFNADVEEVPFINREISLSRIPEENYLRTGDLVIADASEDYADVGKCIEIGNTGGQRFLAGLHTLLARPKRNFFADGFGTYLMKAWPTRRQIMREAQGTKVFGISTGRLAKITLITPSVPEQTRIAGFLSILDGRIELVDRQLEKTRDFKKGLLQQMFV